MSSDLNHVSNCDQLSKMLGEVAVDVHGVKGRHKQEIWWWHTVNCEKFTVLWGKCCFRSWVSFCFVVWCLFQRQLFNHFQPLEKAETWMHGERVYSSALRVGCWKTAPNPLQPPLSNLMDVQAAPPSKFQVFVGIGWRNKHVSAIVFSRRYAKSIRYVYMLIMWRSQHYSDSPPEKEVMTSSRSEIFENWRVSNPSNKTGTNSRKSKR